LTLPRWRRRALARVHVVGRLPALLQPEHEILQRVVDVAEIVLVGLVLPAAAAVGEALTRWIT
jgi:hypothetical protein